MKVKKDIYIQDNSTEVRYMQLPIRDLISSQKYQRDYMRKRTINNIVKDFNPHKLGVIKVSFRDGKYYVYDGQHRLTALLMLYPDGMYNAPCEVHYGLTYKEEAKLFSTQKKDGNGLLPSEEFNSCLEAEDEQAMEIYEIVSEVGLTICLSSGGDKGGKLRCIRKLESIYKKYGSLALQRILWLIKNTWNGNADSLKNPIIGGVCIFYITHQNEIEDKVFMKSLGVVSPSEIVSKGKSDSSASGDLRFAKAIWRAYNNRLTVNRLEYKFKG